MTGQSLPQCSWFCAAAATAAAASPSSAGAAALLVAVAPVPYAPVGGILWSGQLVVLSLASQISVISARFEFCWLSIIVHTKILYIVFFLQLNIDKINSRPAKYCFGICIFSNGAFKKSLAKQKCPNTKNYWYIHTFVNIRDAQTRCLDKMVRQDA